jgi:hypothetical protein
VIAVVAPFPRPQTVTDGWRSRMAVVDRLFEEEPRVYLDVTDDRSVGAPEPEDVSELVRVYRLNVARASHYERLRNVVLSAEMVYVHTIHLARYVLPFYRTGRIVTDIHGAAPEEELLYGRKASCRFYDEVEKIVLAESRYAVTVTRAMVEHLRAKHPETRTEFIVLPILDAGDARPESDLGPRSPSGRPTVIYTGALQHWQNVDLMIETARDGIGRFDFTFLTNDPDGFASAARAGGIERLVSVKCAQKPELPGFYRRADYGLVLRDDLVVNRVACPTKLSEYLWFGVIPVVKFPGLGDFPRFGYRYVTLEDFRAGRLPDPDEQRAMRRSNYEAIEKVQATFEDGAKTLRRLKDRMPRGDEGTIAFLSDLERNVLFPAISTLEIETAGPTGAGRRVVTEDFAEPYHSVEFDLGPVAGIRRLTWMPIDRECQLVLRQVSISDASGREIDYRMSGNFDARTGTTLTFHSPSPRLHFDLSAGALPRRFAAQFDLVLVGDEVPGGERSATGGLGARLRHGIRGRLRSYPLVLKAYRRFVMPIRQRLQRAPATRVPPAGLGSG